MHGADQQKNYEIKKLLDRFCVLFAGAKDAHQKKEKEWHLDDSYAVSGPQRVKLSRNTPCQNTLHIEVP